MREKYTVIDILASHSKTAKVIFIFLFGVIALGAVRASEKHNALASLNADAKKLEDAETDCILRSSKDLIDLRAAGLIQAKRTYLYRKGVFENYGYTVYNLLYDPVTGECIQGKKKSKQLKSK